MAIFSMDSDRKLIPVDSYLGIQYESHVSAVVITSPRIVAGIDITNYTANMVLEDFPMIHDGHPVIETDLITYTFELSDVFTQKAGTLSVQLVLSDTGPDDLITVVRSELAYGIMKRSQALGDEPSELYPTILLQASELLEQSEDARDKAKESETNAKASELAAKQSEDNAKDSENAAKLSEDNAKASELAAKQSEDNAKDSEVAAKESETNAAISADSAQQSCLSMAFVSFTVNENGHVIMKNPELLGTSDFRLRNGRLEVLI